MNKMQIGDSVEIKAQVVDYNDSLEKIKLRILGYAEDKKTDAERYIWVNYSDVKQLNLEFNERKTMELKEFAKSIDGRQYYQMFTKEELQLAKDNGIVIVTGASDDLIELEGAITDEGDCYEGGKIYVKAIPNGGIVHNCERSDVFGFTAKWCEEKDEHGTVIPWTYDVPIEHETFMIYEDNKPYCRGFVFKV